MQKITRQLLSIGLIIIILQNCNRPPANNPKEWKKIIQQHITRYPEMGLQDVYKMLYQATYGPAHLGVEKTRIAKSLQAELATVSPDSSVALIESICPSDRYIRINLKRFTAAAMETELLVEAVYRSCQPEPQGRTALQRQMAILHTLIQQERLPFREEQFLKFSKAIAAKDYPIAHHTAAYLRHYDPAYRVVNKSVWKNLTAKQERGTG